MRKVMQELRIDKYQATFTFRPAFPRELKRSIDTSSGYFAAVAVMPTHNDARQPLQTAFCTSVMSLVD